MKLSSTYHAISCERTPCGGTCISLGENIAEVEGTLEETRRGDDLPPWLAEEDRPGEIERLEKDLARLQALVTA